MLHREGAVCLPDPIEGFTCADLRPLLVLRPQDIRWAMRRLKAIVRYDQTVWCAANDEVY